MSWKTVKNLLILLLIAVNILLAVFAFDYYTDSNFTSADTAAGAAKILEKSGLYVESGMLSVKNDTAPALYTSYDRETYVCLVAHLLFGKEPDGIYMLPHGVRAETLDGKTAYIGYDMSVEYTAGENISSALENAKSADGEMTKAAREFLEEKFALAEGSIKESDCKVSGDCTFVTLGRAERGLKLYGMECTFGVRDGEIVYACGKYFFLTPTGEENAQLLDRVNIMFSEKERGVRGTLESAELCYTLYENADSGLMLFIPSYALTYRDGTVHAVNGVSKKLY
ncbi:MAG: hypothetical protein IJ002_02110 [Clostridia bacterium]|nr:hypothetical protein [Clostridia bacterium]